MVCLSKPIKTKSVNCTALNIYNDLAANNVENTQDIEHDLNSTAERTHKEDHL